MNRMWQKAIGTAAIGLVLGTVAVGCARPAPRPNGGQNQPTPMGQRELNEAVKKTVASVGGVGTVEAVVLGNTAIVAIQLNQDPPGGLEGDSLLGSTDDPDYPGWSSGHGPRKKRGPGGHIGVNPALPGGAVNPGGGTPGGSPNYTQAAPNASMGQATQDGTGVITPAPTPSAWGSAPMDLFNRLANQIRAKHREVGAVRVATRPEDARRLAEIAREVRNGQPMALYTEELNGIMARAVPAGTESIAPDYPPVGQQPIQ